LVTGPVLYVRSQKTAVTVTVGKEYFTVKSTTVTEH